VKLLIDQNLAGRVATDLRTAGHDAVHVSERGLSTADDDEVLALAVTEGRVLVSEDTDFGALLARSRSGVPSFVLIRAAEPMTSSERATLLIANLPEVEADLEAGAIVVFARGRVRVRPLPLESPE
jgi:predicted nuclease of predicted toxin-antitoxin system